MRLYWNPFKCYALTCVLVLAVYLLEFSDLYPKLGFDLFLFLSITGCVSAVLSLSMSSIRLVYCDFGEQINQAYIAVAISAGFILELLYTGAIPIVAAATGADYDYREFGIPTFHVVLIGVCFFYSIYWWDLYLQGRDRRFGLIAFTGVFWALIIVNRGAILISLAAFVFAYGNRVGLKRRMLPLVLSSMFVVWGFGVVGELRTKAMGVDDDLIILEIGQATDRFKESPLPSNFFWFYLYASSPLANLQNTAENRSYTNDSYVAVVVDFLPDFISKRLLTEAQIEAVGPSLITPQLTVATAFGRPLSSLGWGGPYLLFAYFATCAGVAIRYIRSSRYSGALVAMFCAQGCLMFFDNMMVFSGAICPMLVGLSLVFFERRRIRFFKSTGSA